MNETYILRTETWDGILASQLTKNYEDLRNLKSYAWRNRNIKKIMILLRRPHCKLQLLHTETKKQKSSSLSLGDSMDFSSLGIIGVEAVGSGLIGFILGYGIKKIVKILFYAVAIIAAIIFVPVAYVAYKYPGVITINWTELFNALGDQANSTVNYLSTTSTSVLQMFPSASAFVVCLLVGFSKG